jgi:acyl-coenzyme A synthetase/AMP-(fatty) acid ligase
VLVARSRHATTVAALAALRSGRELRLPASHAPEAIRAAAGPDGALVHDGTGEQGMDLRRLPAGEPHDVDVEIDDTPFARLFTSGSTGAPQDVVKTRRQLLGEAHGLAVAFDLGPADRVISSVPSHHVYGLLFGVLAPLCGGAALDDLTPLLPAEVAARAAAVGATALISVPAHLRALADAAPPDLRRLRHVFSSGAALPDVVAEAWEAAYHIPVTEVFGSTETGGIAYRRGREPSTWRPFPGVKVSVDEDDRLWLDSPWLAPGAPRPWPTDDRARLEADGRFAHLGRLDDVVKVASRRVSRAEVERAIFSVPGVEDAAVIPIDDPARGAVLRALIVGPVELDTVRQALLLRFDPVVIPRLMRCAALPREATGKLQRAKLLAMLRPPLAAILLELTVEADEATARVRIPAAHPAFRGHFPGRPILPGAALLSGVVAPALRRAWPAAPALRGLELITFHRPILPDDTLSLTLRRAGDTVRFGVGRGDETIATGTLRLDAPPT